jgi:hypothetical protein
MTESIDKNKHQNLFRWLKKILKNENYRASIAGMIGITV